MGGGDTYDGVVDVENDSTIGERNLNHTSHTHPSTRTQPNFHNATIPQQSWAGSPRPPPSPMPISRA